MIYAEPGLFLRYEPLAASTLATWGTQRQRAVVAAFDDQRQPVRPYARIDDTQQHAALRHLYPAQVRFGIGVGRPGRAVGRPRLGFVTVWVLRGLAKFHASLAVELLGRY